MSFRKLLIGLVPLLALAAGGWYVGGKYMKAKVDTQRQAAIDAFVAADCTRSRDAAQDVASTVSLGRDLGFSYRDARKLTGWDYGWEDQAKEDAYRIRNTCDRLREVERRLAEGKPGEAARRLIDLVSKSRTSLKQGRDTFHEARLTQAAARAAGIISDNAGVPAGIYCGTLQEYTRTTPPQGARYAQATRPLDEVLQAHLPAQYLRCAKSNLAQGNYPAAAAMIRYVSETNADGRPGPEARELLHKAIVEKGQGCTALREPNHPQMRNFYRALTNTRSGEWLPFVADDIPGLQLQCADKTIDNRQFLEAAKHYRAFLDGFPDDPRRAVVQKALTDLPLTQAEGMLADGKLQQAEELFVWLKQRHGDDETGQRATQRLAQIEIEKAKRLGAGELRPVPGVRYAETGPARLTLVNGTRYRLKVAYDGPNADVTQIPACDSCQTRPDGCTAEMPKATYELLPGQYELLVSALGTSSIQAYTGIFDLGRGLLYQQCLVIVTRER